MAWTPWSTLTSWTCCSTDPPWTPWRQWTLKPAPVLWCQCLHAPPQACLLTPGLPVTALWVVVMVMVMVMVVVVVGLRVVCSPWRERAWGREMASCLASPSLQLHP